MQKISLVEPASGFSSVLGKGVEAKMENQIKPKWRIKYTRGEIK